MEIPFWLMWIQHLQLKQIHQHQDIADQSMNPNLEIHRYQDFKKYSLS